MDPTRTVVPLHYSSDGKNVCVAVYFRQGQHMNFSGKTEIPISLFTGTKYDTTLPERIGFVLYET